jgi:hypothetical protein
VPENAEEKSLRIDPFPREDSGQALPPLVLRLARDDSHEVCRRGEAKCKDFFDTLLGSKFVSTRQVDDE